MNLLLFLVVCLIALVSFGLTSFYSVAITHFVDQYSIPLLSIDNTTTTIYQLPNTTISITMPSDQPSVSFQTLLQTIGGLHMYFPDRPIAIQQSLFPQFTKDEQDELSHLVNVHLIQDPIPGSPSIPVGHCVASPTTLSSNRPCSPDYLCAVRHDISSPPRQLVRTNPDLISQVCIVSAIYGPKSRQNDFLTMFLRSAVKAGLGSWNISFLLSTQVDPVFDDTVSLSEFVDEFHGIVGGHQHRLHILRLPLNRPLTDLAHKWNALGRQVLKSEQCQWILQVIDDTWIEGDSGWLDQLIRDWTAMGRGVVGDGWNERLFNAMLVGREHLRIFGGNVWDPYMVNWHIDDWARLVYGPRYTRHRHFIRHAKGSTAYQVCDGAIWCRCGMRRDRQRISDFYGQDPYFVQLATEGGEQGCEDVDRVRVGLDRWMLPVK